MVGLGRRVVCASLSMRMVIDYIGFIRRGNFYFLLVQRHAVSRELREMTDCLSRSEISQNLIRVHEEEVFRLQRNWEIGY